MKKAMVVFALAALVFTFTMGAMAADKCASKKAESSCCPKNAKACDAKPCPKECADITLKGKVETREENNQNVAYVTITEAKTADGKTACCAVGNTVKVTGDKAADVAKLCGKEVTLKGTCKKCREFVATEIAG